MSAEELDLDGVWSGSYSYGLGEDPVPFTAWIESFGQQFAGTTLEPNTFADPALEELSAEIDGDVSGIRLIFVKRYLEAPGCHREPITYEGTISNDGSEIRGSWEVGGGLYERVAGVFYLSRLKQSVATSLLTSAKADD